ncbi:hypothetical protein FisN_1Hu019 [Fistulifera solaris]|uniref:J domain-containing protein n=1 Tax=Fistulifera solaris TaxID=1519565 RepID=A0A1Z5KRN5_FISSO|nr:hypothetical protein FisN_1Hu019 [Fistulifera solaris]|eukprot:GAX28983.1 hypothetical protein FisN_1Hu019 [Fistulifera solaris]
MTSFRRAFRGGQDHYSILQISRSATLPEVKAAYKRLALLHHPDRHGGSPEKRSDFQKLNEAYEFVLQDLQNNKRRRDVNAQGPHFRNINYRKVYAPRPPPDWKFTWNHEEHQEMHYGKGLQREALKQTLRESEKELRYESPLGKGFTFSSVDDEDDDVTGSSKGKADTTHVNINPFSKNTPQGPPKVIIDYQEGEFDPNLQGRARMNRQERIVHDMYSRRTERIKKENKNEQRSKPFQYAKYHRFHRDIHQVPEQTPDGVNSTFVGRSGRPSNTSNECVIL